MKENTFLNNVKTKTSTLGMTALLTLNSVSLAFAEQTGGNAANPANEATNTINDLSGMLRLVFPGIAKQSNMVILFKYSGQSNLVPASVRDSRSKKDYIEYNPKGFVKKLEVFDDQGNLVFEEKNPIPGIKKKSKKRYKKEKKKRLNNRK